MLDRSARRSEVAPRRIFHPRCAECGAHMWLSRIESGDLDQRRTFECPPCGSVAVRVVRHGQTG